MSKIIVLCEVVLLLLHKPDAEESDMSVSNNILITSNMVIISEGPVCKPKVIKILSSESKIIIISNSYTILADENMHGTGNSTSSNRLLVYYYYSYMCFVCSIKIS